MRELKWISTATLGHSNYDFIISTVGLVAVYKLYTMYYFAPRRRITSRSPLYLPVLLSLWRSTTFQNRSINSRLPPTHKSAGKSCENLKMRIVLALMSEIGSHLLGRLTPTRSIRWQAFREDLYFYWLGSFPPKIPLANQVLLSIFSDCVWYAAVDFIKMRTI